ncbi:hypothetical protein DdX_17784 [Ditylenchus destructor]|uniref:Uncharacterized protein n=1 Tax=Ditylenchus destructor TaxID=166010 RepID=A0AAD4QYV5_9BILA|nr:hypothetical protein DdX_17784 [Ditylenchus destructor]
MLEAGESYPPSLKRSRKDSSDCPSHKNTQPSTSKFSDKPYLSSAGRMRRVMDMIRTRKISNKCALIWLFDVNERSRCELAHCELGG